ncbi:MAG: TonB family protein [bacterium]
MRRGLPYSVTLHVIILVVTVVYGAHVQTPQLDPRQVIRVQIVDPPQQAMAAETEPAPPEPTPEQDEPEPEITPPEPVPVEEPDPEPRIVPEPEPQQVVVAPEPEVQEPPAKPVVVAEPPPTLSPIGDVAPETTDIRSTDEPFPFAWYLQLVKGRILRNWNPPQVSMRGADQMVCVIHFFIERGGAVTRPTIVSSSGITLLDRSSLRAVQAAHPLPPLPREFGSPALGLTYTFVTKSALQGP